MVTTFLVIHTFCLLIYFKPMLYFNVPRENICLICSGGTKVKHWFKILLFLFNVSENPDRKFWLVYSGITVCSWLFLEDKANTMNLEKIRNRSCLLEFRAHQKFDFLYKKSLLLFNTKILPSKRIWLMLCFF